MEKATYVATKLSVLFLYRRIFWANKTFRRIADAIAVLIVLWGVVFLLVESFICMSDGSTSVTCAAQEWALLWFGITDVLGDLLVLWLPCPRLRELQMGGREKVGLVMIFALGTL